MASGDDSDVMMTIGRPQRVAFKPERVYITPDPNAKDWVINDIRIVQVVDDSLVADAYRLDRRKAGRKIRQNRRKVRRLAEGRFVDADERVPESVQILLRRERSRRARRSKSGRAR